ncbi:MAG: type IV secretion system DNA-binding domain-containing protein [Planctomycetaceae bacterium]
MRNIYHQSAGNPIQPNRLPLTSSSIKLFAERWRANSWHSPVWMLLYGALSLVLLVYMKASGITLLLHPFDLLLSPAVMIFALILGRLSEPHRQIMMAIAIVATALLGINSAIPAFMQLLLFAGVMGVLVYLFGSHSAAMLTALPVEHSVGLHLYRASRQTLMKVAASTAGVVVIVVSLGMPWILMGVLLAVVILPFTVSSPRKTWRVIWQQCVSWFCYEPPANPGILQSPAGSIKNRGLLMLLASVLMASVIGTGPLSPLRVLNRATKAANAALLNVTERPQSRLPSLGEMDFLWLLVFAATIVVILLLPIAMTVLITTPLIRDVAEKSRPHRTQSLTQAVVETLGSSPSPIDRNSLYFGRVVYDGSPVLVPRSVFDEHAHAVGASGSGKTSLFLCPIIEQLANGECSVIVLDLKADTLELLATLAAAAERLRAGGRDIPLKYFSNQSSCPTFAFNPMTQRFWDSLDLQAKTDMLCAANGLDYGNGYGAGYFSSANSAVLHHALKAFPHVRTFRELAECIGTVITTAKKRDLHPEIRKAGVHVQEVIKRLAGCDPLNVTPQSGYPGAVTANAIDLTEPFLTPQLMYFHLSATLSPSGAAEIARLVTYMLLAASTPTQRKHKVYLVIDEFQRIVANNLEYMLQLARSMGVGIILANQSMEDLKKGTTNLIPAIEANCRLRQWFSVSCSEDRERLIRSGGETVDVTKSVSTGSNSDGTSNTSTTSSEMLVPRITMNDILLMSDHPFQSILQIARSSGYAQFGGFPVIIESGYHISQEEYQRRCRMTWPETPGAYVPGRFKPSTPARPATSGPRVTEETIDGPSQVSPEAIEEMLRGIEEDLGMGPRPPRKNGGES